MVKREEKTKEQLRVDPKLIAVDAKLIKNKAKRSEVREKQNVIKKQQKSLKRKLNKEDPNHVPQKVIMQEDRREKDDTIVAEEDDLTEIKEEEECDEFFDYFKDNKPPKLLVTTAINFVQKKQPSKYLIQYCRELLLMFPNSHYCRRKNFTIEKIQSFGIENDFTDIMIIGERNNFVDSMTLIHLPEGPCSFYRISNMISSKKIKNHATPSDYFPELILNNFNTRLGLRIARSFNSLIPQNPEFKGRRVITFHNQRDFVFVRHHRYEFENKDSCILQEIGPSFTMRLEKVQLGKFDGKFGEYEWYHSAKMDTSRRKFYL